MTAAKPSPPMSLKELLEEDTASEEIMEAYRALEARVRELEADLRILQVALRDEGWEAWKRERRAALREGKP